MARDQALGEDVAVRPRGQDRTIVGGYIEAGDGMGGHGTIMVVFQTICKLFRAPDTTCPAPRGCR